MDQLAGLLANRTQRYERWLGLQPGLFFELTTGRSQEIFPRFGKTFGDGPSARVLALPERTTGVGQKHLELAARLAIEQKARTRLGRLQGQTLSAQE
jgi:hypothetical protein